MYETTADLEHLQALLDDSYQRAGGHLTGIHSDRARVTPASLTERLVGMHVIVVATVSSDGRPFTGPVDAFLYRGRFVFGTAANALRARHLARSPAVSATYVQGEQLVVTVHGRAERLDLSEPDDDFVAMMRAQYGSDWNDLGGGGNPYYAIVPARMFAADMSVYAAQAPAPD